MTRLTAEQRAQLAMAAAGNEGDLSVHSAAALKAAKKMLRSLWREYLRAKDREGRTAAHQAEERIDEELYSRELDGTLASRQQTHSRGFSI